MSTGNTPNAMPNSSPYKNRRVVVRSDDLSIKRRCADRILPAIEPSGDECWPSFSRGVIARPTNLNLKESPYVQSKTEPDPTESQLDAAVACCAGDASSSRKSGDHQ